jgi:hypothetical protein
LIARTSAYKSTRSSSARTKKGSGSFIELVKCSTVLFCELYSKLSCIPYSSFSITLSSNRN